MHNGNYTSFTAILLVLISSNIIAQEESGELGWKNLEIFLGWRGISTFQNDSIVFKMKSMTNQYDNTFHLISNSANITYQFPPSISTYDYVKNTILNISPMWTWLGFNFLGPPNDYDCTGSEIPLYTGSCYIPMETFNYGLFYFSAEIFHFDSQENERRGEFYIDFRDTDYDYSTGDCHGADIWIKYEANSSPYFFIRGCDAPIQADLNFDGIFDEPFNDDWSSIGTRELLTIWKLKKGTGYTPATTNFEEFWQNTLAVVPSADNHPLLVWGSYPVNQQFPAVDYYAISRKNGGLDWEENFATTTDGFYEDTDFTMPGVYHHTIQYRVRAVQAEPPNYTYSAYSNAAAIDINGNDPGKKNIERIKQYTFTLNRNYPNPFNPTTRIDYNLQKASQVILEVYNIYGSRVAVLVDEYKKEGTYSVNFNAGNLASGVYFYKLQAGEFISTKKMTLLK